jgi:hypothetical protein
MQCLLSVNILQRKYETLHLDILYNNNNDPQSDKLGVKLCPASTTSIAARDVEGRGILTAGLYSTPLPAVHHPRDHCLTKIGFKQITEPRGENGVERGGQYYLKGSFLLCI